MKKLLFPSLILFLLSVSCTNSTQAPATDSANLQDTLKIDTTDFNAAAPAAENTEGEEGDEEEGGLNYKDSTVSDNGDYHFTLIPYLGESGGELRILNKKTGKSYVESGIDAIQSYEGEYLVTSGATTTSMNNFSVIKLSDGSNVFGSEYTNGFDVKKGIISFKAPVQATDIPKLPTCSKDLTEQPQNIGYVELQKYDLKTLKHIKTGTFECYFAE